MPSFAATAADIAAQYTDQRIDSHGRFPSLHTDPDKVDLFLQVIREGNYFETACAVAGLAKNTVYTWLKRAETGQEPYLSFQDAFKRAEAGGERDLLGCVTRAGREPHNWTAAMTAMERRWPDKWGRRSEANNGPQVLVQVGIQNSDVSVSVQALPQVNQTSVIGHEQEANALPVIELPPAPKQLSGAKVRGERVQKKRKRAKRVPRQLGAQTPAQGPTGDPRPTGGAGESVDKS